MNPRISRVALLILVIGVIAAVLVLIVIQPGNDDGTGAGVAAPVVVDMD